MKKFNIYKFKPCLDATKYYDACKSSEEAWNNCSRGDWMLWITSNLEVDIKILTLAKVHCALTVKHLMKDKRSIEALEVALKFVNGKATLEELKIAADAAYIAVNAACIVTNAAACIVTDAAAYAAYATYANYTIHGAIYNSANDAKIKNQLKTANVCRKYLTESIFKILLF